MSTAPTVNPQLSSATTELSTDKVPALFNTVDVEIIWQLLESVTVQVYVPADKEVISSVLGPLDQLNTNGRASPSISKSIAPDPSLHVSCCIKALYG